MSKPASGSARASAAIGAQSRLADVMLVRIAAAGGSERDIARDLHPWADAKASAQAWRVQISQGLAALSIRGLVASAAGRTRATEAGRKHALAFLGLPGGDIGPWPAMRDGPLVEVALGLQTAAPARRKAAARLEGLRGLIVETTWNIENSGRPSATRIRSKLALTALQRVFGDTVDKSLQSKSAMSASASRLLAAQVSKTPRQHATDARLVAQLAAEAIGVTRADLASLRRGVLRRYLAQSDATAETVAAPASPRAITDAPVPLPAASPRVQTQPPQASSSATAARVRLVTPPAAPVASQPVDRRPDPATFARAVQDAAKVKAEGWPGNRKAFVSRVWTVVQERHPEWGIGVIEFKGMLAEVHRIGLLGLANADLKDRRTLAEVEASAVSYKNTVWHYVRVDD